VVYRCDCSLLEILGESPGLHQGGLHGDSFKSGRKTFATSPSCQIKSSNPEECKVIYPDFKYKVYFTMKKMPGHFQREPGLNVYFGLQAIFFSIQ
jgi:hypothetical protein